MIYRFVSTIWLRNSNKYQWIKRYWIRLLKRTDLRRVRCHLRARPITCKHKRNRQHQQIKHHRRQRAINKVPGYYKYYNSIINDRYLIDQDPLKEVQISSSSMESTHDDDEREAPSVVVYLVDPFSMGTDQPELQRIACISLLRCYQSGLAALPENIRSNISVQVRESTSHALLILTIDSY